MNRSLDFDLPLSLGRSCLVNTVDRTGRLITTVETDRNTGYRAEDMIMFLATTRLILHTIEVGKFDITNDNEPTIVSQIPGSELLMLYAAAITGYTANPESGSACYRRPSMAWTSTCWRGPLEPTRSLLPGVCHQEAPRMVHEEQKEPGQCHLPHGLQ